MKSAWTTLALLASALAWAEGPAPSPSPERSSSPLAVETPVAPTQLTLEGSIETALREATDVLKAQNAREQRGAELLQGYAQFLPDLNTSLGYGYTSGTTLYAITGIDSVYSRNQHAEFGITSTLNLFNGLGDMASLRAAMRRHEAASLTLEFARLQIRLDVTQRYLQEQLDGQLLEIAKQNLQASQARLKQLRGQFEVGSTSPADLQRQVAQAAADEQSVAAADLRAHDDLLELVRRLRLDPARPYELAPAALEVRIGTDDPAARSEAELIRGALERRKDLASSGATHEAADQDVTRARAPYFPRLDLVFNRSAAGTALIAQTLNGVDVMPASQSALAAQLGSQVDYSIGLALSWNVFNRLVDRTHVVQARVAADNAEIDADDLRLKVTADVRAAKKGFSTAMSQLTSAKAGVQAADVAFRTIEARYRVGASNFIDVLAAQSALAQAQAAQAQAAVNLKYQERQLAFVVGD